MANKDKIKCFILDNGDSEIVAYSMDILKDCIEGEVDELRQDFDKVELTISVKHFTQKEIDEMPEYEG